MARKLKHWIKGYLEYSALSEATDQFHFWSAVSVIAGALRRRVWIDMGYFQWTPNFYIIFVAPPGIVSKSTTASIGMRLLKELPEIKFGPDAVTWQALTMGLAEAREDVPMPDGNFHSMSCLTIVSSEFGTFLNPQDREMVDVLVSLWDGQLGTWEKATKTQGSDKILNPWLNILACTTPAWIAGNFPDYMIGGGFTSRCVFVYGDKKRQLIAYPGKGLPKNFREQAITLIHDLEQISMMAGEYELSPDATAWGTSWYEKHYEETQATFMDESRFAGYKARKQTHMHKLAMVLAAAQRDERVILKEDLVEAERIVTMLERDMPKVFSQIGRSQEAAHTEAIYNLVKRQGAIDKEVLYSEMLHTIGVDMIDAGVRALMTAGMIQLYNHQGRMVYFVKGYSKSS